MLTKIVGNIKQHMFDQIWKFKLDTLLINHLIIEINLYGMVTRRSLREVPQRHCFSMVNKTIYLKLTNCWVKLAMFYKKENHISIIRLKSSVFPTFMQHHVKRNNTTQWLTAMLNGFKHISPLCLSTLCHGKQFILTY